MLAPEVENLILKYLSKQATAQELDSLLDWILIGDNERIFDGYVQLHLEIITLMNGPDIDKIKNHLLQGIKRDKFRKSVGRAMKYAAVGVLFLTLGNFYQQGRFSKIGPSGLVPKEESITITLDNGTIETLGIDENKVVRDAEGNIIGTHNKSKLTYTGVSKGEELVYNTLNIPYGKQFDVVLSDGTHVFLNSGTSLRYPVTFIKGKDRTVFLSGEAYFEVAKDEGHPFVVDANEIQIEVLGTKFNVSRYPEDSNINTVLVEGSIELQIKGNDATLSVPTLLEPGYKAEWQKEEIGIMVQNVETELYTAWMQGKLVFRNTRFKEIRKILERRYSVTIINKDPVLDEQLYDATFDIETIDQVLESFSKSYDIEYVIVNNEVIIT
ncbi:MAG TPA: FecR domain-containing protein [Arenibacter sp.]|nr:FecR domain-containing protein [Arenibacter sp.]